MKDDQNDIRPALMTTDLEDDKDGRKTKSKMT